jgi:hypothetical protein
MMVSSSTPKKPLARASAKMTITVGCASCSVEFCRGPPFSCMWTSMLAIPSGRTPRRLGCHVYLMATNTCESNDVCEGTFLNSSGDIAEFSQLARAAASF